MPCHRRKPTYRKKSQARRHGAISYGSRNHREYKVKHGWRTSKK
jgi:hypothetical protein